MPFHLLSLAEFQHLPSTPIKGKTVGPYMLAPHWNKAHLFSLATHYNPNNNLSVFSVMTCDNLIARAHSTMTCTNGNRFGSICTFKPELGYGLRGEHVIRCDGTVAGDPPSAYSKSKLK